MPLLPRPLFSSRAIDHPPDDGAAGRLLATEIRLGPGVTRPTGTVLFVQLEIRVISSGMASGVLNSRGLDAVDVRGNVSPDVLFSLAPYFKAHQVLRYSRVGRT
jgi:hypothetical protein